MIEAETLLRERMLSLLGRPPIDTQWLTVAHDGTPVTKARARFSPTGRCYTPSATSAAQDAMSWRFKVAMIGRDPFKGNVAIVSIFYMPTKRRIDCDNLTKLVMDAATKAGVWKDDSQVTTQAAFLEWDVTHPRTLVAICPCTSTLIRG